MKEDDRLRIILNANIILRSISKKSPYKLILDHLLDGKYDMFYTNEISLEQEEKLKEIFGEEVSELFLGAITWLPNVFKTDIFYHFSIIDEDPEYNKFIDCAFSSNAHFLVTNDKHFNRLKSIDFLNIGLLRIDEFQNLLLNKFQ